MSYGDPAAEGAHRWALADDEAQPFFRQAIELGITFWDTANVYQEGTSEEVVGRAMGRYSRREDIVLATKVFGKMHDGPGGSGLSRKGIMEQIDARYSQVRTDARPSNPSNDRHAAGMSPAPDPQPPSRAQHPIAVSQQLTPELAGETDEILADRHPLPQTLPR